MFAKLHIYRRYVHVKHFWKPNCGLTYIMEG